MFCHWQQVTQPAQSDEPLCSHSYCTFSMLRHEHMPTQHMCIEQDKKCFSFSQRKKTNHLFY